MFTIDRRMFLALLGAAGVEATLPASAHAASTGKYPPARIENEYSRLLPGERESLAVAPTVTGFAGGHIAARLGGNTATLLPGQALDGWQLLTSVEINGVRTAVFEKHATCRGAIAYVTERAGTIALIPKGIGELAHIRPRPFPAPARLQRSQVPGPDVAGAYILNSNEDPCYENVAALGPEYIGWSLVANEQAGPLRSLYLQADGTSRQPAHNPQSEWAPDLGGALFDPQTWIPFDDPGRYRYEPGWSKRTLLGGYLPVADTGVWNTEHKAGYEVMVLLPPGADAQPMARIRVTRLPEKNGVRESGNGAANEAGGFAGPMFDEHYWNCNAGSFFSALAGIWNHWHDFHENAMPVEIPDPWLLDAARAGLTLARCSYRGLEPTYQVGEGGYTKIPERSHALFPVAHYEFIWAHQLWNMTAESDPYADNYLTKYVLPDGNFLYNTQDQVEAPLNVGLFLWNNARAWDYTRDLQAFERRLPVLERMLAYVLVRYEFGKERYPLPDRRYGLVWGSPEADLGDPANDSPESHPLYYQNAAHTWRGLTEHARVLTNISKVSGKPEHATLGTRYRQLAEEMRTNIERSLAATIAAGSPAMRAAGIPPFEPNDTAHRPADLSSYENHRFMEDWFLADWGSPAIDAGHLKHRAIAGLEICGLNTDGPNARDSNFTMHGTLAARIRQKDYRPYLLSLYALVCFAADSGNRYAPEDAYIPGSYPGEQSEYGWSAVINSTLQPTLGLRWLLCYEESDYPGVQVDAQGSTPGSSAGQKAAVCHLQKAAPKHWFAPGERIRVQHCPTRWGPIGWMTESLPGRGWKVTIEVPIGFTAAVAIHIHPPDSSPLRSTSVGIIVSEHVLLEGSTLVQGVPLELQIT